VLERYIDGNWQLWNILKGGMGLVGPLLFPGH